MHRLCGHDVPEWAIVVFGRGRGDLQMRTKPTMHKRMLRSALVAAFSTAVAVGALGGLTGTSGDAAQDSTWKTTSVSAAGAGDSTWAVTASDVPGDSTWVAPAAPGDSTWVAPAVPGDSTWVAPSDSTWVAPAVPGDSTWAAES
jgi:hypothetical protein